MKLRMARISLKSMQLNRGGFLTFNNKFHSMIQFKKGCNATVIFHGFHGNDSYSISFNVYVPVIETNNINLWLIRSEKQ